MEIGEQKMNDDTRKALATVEAMLLKTPFLSAAQKEAIAAALRAMGRELSELRALIQQQQQGKK
jgi:hypothetical protein